jgi:hypothetical protein
VTSRHDWTVADCCHAPPFYGSCLRGLHPSVLVTIIEGTVPQTFSISSQSKNINKQDLHPMMSYQFSQGITLHGPTRPILLQIVYGL